MFVANPAKPEFPTVADALLHFVESGAVKRETIARAGKTSYSTACRWVKGEQEPTVSEFCLLVERLPREVADGLRTLLPCGRDFAAAELDLDGNGRVDVRDLLAEAVRESGEYHDTLRRTHSLVAAGGMPLAHEVMELLAMNGRRSESCRRERAIIERLGQTVARSSNGHARAR